MTGTRKSAEPGGEVASLQRSISVSNFSPIGVGSRSARSRAEGDHRSVALAVNIASIHVGIKGCISRSARRRSVSFEHAFHGRVGYQFLGGCVRGLPCPTVTAADYQAMCCPRFFSLSPWTWSLRPSIRD